MPQLFFMLTVLCLRCSAATMTITLVNLQNGSPVEGAEATVSHPGQQLAEFVSGADGKFTFPVADGARFTIKIQKTGFVDPLDQAGLGSEYGSIADSSHSITITNQSNLTQGNHNALVERQKSFKVSQIGENL